MLGLISHYPEEEAEAERGKDLAKVAKVVT